MASRRSRPGSTADKPRPERTSCSTIRRPCSARTVSSTSSRVSKVVRYSTTLIPQRRFEPDADTLGLYHCDEGLAVGRFERQQPSRHANRREMGTIGRRNGNAGGRDVDPAGSGRDAAPSPGVLFPGPKLGGLEIEPKGAAPQISGWSMMLHVARRRGRHGGKTTPTCRSISNLSALCGTEAMIGAHGRKPAAVTMAWPRRSSTTANRLPSSGHGRRTQTRRRYEAVLVPLRHAVHGSRDLHRHELVGQGGTRITWWPGA